MIVDFERKLTLRCAKEEGNYASLSKILRYGGKKYIEESNLSSLYKFFKKNGDENTYIMYFNDKWTNLTTIFEQLGISFNKDYEFMKDDK